MGRAKQRADRIRERVGITEFLEDLGYAVRSHGGHREQQFSCDLHGDGTDSKPSARVYPSSNSWYCFACSKKRDSITTLMDKKGLNFYQACDTIEKKYGLPPLPYEKNENAYSEFSFQEKEPTYEEITVRVSNLILMQRNEKTLTFKQYLSLWEVYDMVVYKVENNKLDKEKGLGALKKLRDKTLQYIKENSRA